MPNKKNHLPFRMSRVANVASFAFLLMLHLVFSMPALGQSLSIKGKVLNESGTPLEGASVTQKGSGTGTVTDRNGVFSISVPNRAVLVISATGYTEKEVTVSGTAEISVQLEVDQKSLEEVVVVGYGTQRKIDVTGAVSRVNLESQVNAPNTNIGQFLQGTVPGLNVGVSTFAGGTPPINIRGRVTINGSQSTLIILDGIQYNGSLSSINPD
ncbi:MAG: carboxypeptidase-like regulatory domain-containing protein, partial [Lacibacter sp.]|nr:carboxypeptidase-like regulatory domain-containing protein [Lacibacter sp.]